MSRSGSEEPEKGADCAVLWRRDCGRARKKRTPEGLYPDSECASARRWPHAFPQRRIEPCIRSAEIAARRDGTAGIAACRRAGALQA